MDRFLFTLKINFFQLHFSKLVYEHCLGDPTIWIPDRDLHFILVMGMCKSN
jgi:hypothetical protein